MLYMNVAEGCGVTGNLLRDLLRERGVQTGSYNTHTGAYERLPGGNAVLCWGNGYTGRLPALNRNCTAHNKLQQLQILALPESHNLRTVPIIDPRRAADFPAFMRKSSHAGGTDIRLALEPPHASLFLNAGWNFGTKYIPTATEFRVWVYRRQHLGTYEKHLARPQEFLASRQFGANFDNGYSFRLVTQENLPTAAIEMAKSAVQALGLDFGAVDILKGRDGNFYILEVNTAPGVEGPDRQVIQALADKIAYWVGHRCPRRSGGEEEYERPGQAATPPAPRARITAIEAEGPTVPEATTRRVAAEMESRPSFLPRRNESWQDYVTRINA